MEIGPIKKPLFNMLLFFKCELLFVCVGTDIDDVNDENPLESEDTERKGSSIYIWCRC